MTPASSPTGDTAAVPPVPTLDRDGSDERFVMAAAEANRAGEDVGHLPTVADELYSMVQRRDAEIDRLRAELAEEKREHLATINDALRVKQAWAAREQTLAAPPAASSSPDDTAPGVAAARNEARFQYLASLPLDWDSYGADRIDPECITRARSALAALCGPVSISGTVRGGIFLTWQDEHVTLELDPGGRLSASVGDDYAESEAVPAPADGDTEETRRG